MSYDDRREIFDRLEALERMLRGERDSADDRRRGDHRRHHHHDDRGCDERGRREGRDCDERGRRDGGRGDYDEKRIIDTIVHLVVENLDRRLEDRLASACERDGGDEKRFVDLIVGLVAEHVQEIVATELDRRLGRPPLDDAGEHRPPPRAEGAEED